MGSDYRDAILELVRSEFIGPCPDENPTNDGEEIIEGDSPLGRYSVGILYPKEYSIAEAITEVTGDDDDDDDEHLPVDNPPTINGLTDSNTNPEIYQRLSDEELEDDPINLSNAYHQSAVSLTIKKASSARFFRICAKFGLYSKAEATKSGKTFRAYQRNQECVTREISLDVLPTKNNRICSERIFSKGAAQLGLTITNRETSDERTNGMYTFTLVNESVVKTGEFDCLASFFQVEFSVASDASLLPLQDSIRGHVDDDDYLNNQLLFRNVQAFGIGHGCAAAWDQHSSEVNEIRADFIPSYEVRPIIPTKGLNFDMLEMSDEANKEGILAILTCLCNKYGDWIESVEKEVPRLNPELAGAAKRNITECRECLNRMRRGVTLLRDDDATFRAFCLMNEAMLLQQLHYRMPLARWVGGRDGSYKDLGPDVNAGDRTTWPSTETYGKWRTFQIAFILMNMPSMRYEDCPERNIVDLIWFPTGGGKTEAYLGLTAFTLLIRRLLNKDDSGVTVLMRYTLRLLTTQQFERAASLICACEVIRERIPESLGNDRFSIGLWVGQSTSPNTQKDAVSQYERMANSKSGDNPFVLLKCPWCGAEMGLIKDGRHTSIRGYYTKHKPGGGRTKMFYYACSNPKCHFGNDRETVLPIYSIDEDIYENRPSLVIGTVDKFAALTTTSDTRNLFGRGACRFSPPDLIIQDELHLISGSLGSMVGFYETAVDILCTDDAGHHAKVVGSTATISHAKEQCSSLYGRSESQICQFPPSGIDAGNSFFSIEQDDLSKPGRLYVGICSPGCSMAMSIINLYATLLLAPDIAPEDITEKTLDGYRTNLGYFNSLRELGQAATWISGNILENLRAMQRRRWAKDARFQGRNPNLIHHCELTSRISSAEIPSSIKQLEVGLADEQDSKSKPIDVCLATNMVSVGVDIPRLALMTIDGQPKTTSEYIQASSRVGRGDNPGLVITVYSPTKARDKSHYEDFQRYHSRLYCNVEPTSITPFSAPLRDRAMKALIVALVRQLCPFNERDNPQEPSKELFEKVEEIILSRVRSVDIDETDSTQAQIETLLRNWEERMPQQYMSKTTEDITPLIMRIDSKVNPAWQKDSIWEVPSSMRTVDANCLVKGISEYIGGDIDDSQ